MGVMVSEVYDAFLAAGAPEAKARAAAEAIPATEQLATKQDIAELRADMAARETRLVKWGVALVGLAVATESFLDWVIR